MKFWAGTFFGMSIAYTDVGGVYDGPAKWALAITLALLILPSPERLADWSRRR